MFLIKDPSGDLCGLERQCATERRWRGFNFPLATEFSKCFFKKGRILHWYLSLDVEISNQSPSSSTCSFHSAFDNTQTRSGTNCILRIGWSIEQTAQAFQTWPNRRWFSRTQRVFLSRPRLKIQNPICVARMVCTSEVSSSIKMENPCSPPRWSSNYYDPV